MGRARVTAVRLYKFCPEICPRLRSLAVSVGLRGTEPAGQGFVASVDLEENKIKKLAYVPARTVDQIQIGGGDVWVQFDKHLYRTRL